MMPVATVPAIKLAEKASSGEFGSTDEWRKFPPTTTPKAAMYKASPEQRGHIDHQSHGSAMHRMAIAVILGPTDGRLPAALRQQLASGPIVERELD